MTATTLLDVGGLSKLLQEPPGSLVLLDCRFDLGKPDAGRQAYGDGHIPGARYADLNRNLAGPITPGSGRHPLPARDQLAGFFASLGLGADTQVVAYDDATGSFAARAWWLLRWLGHPQVAVLDGGFHAWIAAGGAIESGRPADTESASPPGLRPDAGRLDDFPPAGFRAALFAAGAQAVSSADVMEALHDTGRLLVDARAPERFAGDVEPLDAVAGHVPGAVNHPFSRNLGSENHFLPPAELRRRWMERLDGTDPRDVILMCGSGVTACHNALAMEIAGLPGAKLYAGSWSEWIRDPERPVVRGTAR